MTKKSLTDYIFYLGSAKQASNYETAMDFIINHMKKTYKYGSNLAMAIREGAKAGTNAWKPSLQVSLKTNSIMAANEDKQFAIEFELDYNKY